MDVLISRLTTDCLVSLSLFFKEYLSARTYCTCFEVFLYNTKENQLYHLDKHDELMNFQCVCFLVQLFSRSFICILEFDFDFHTDASTLTKDYKRSVHRRQSKKAWIICHLSVINKSPKFVLEVLYQVSVYILLNVVQCFVSFMCWGFSGVGSC